MKINRLLFFILATILIISAILFLLNRPYFLRRSKEVKDIHAVEHAEDEVTLLFYNWYNDADAQFVEELSKKVKEKYSHITIESQTVNWSSMHSTLKIKIASNEMPELIDFRGMDVPLYAQSGSLIDLTEYPFMIHSDLQAREHIKYRGRDYGLPYTVVWQGVIYNKDIFKYYQLDIPNTYEDLMETCRVLSNNGIIPFATHYKDSWNIGNIAMQSAMAEVYSKYPDWGNRMLFGKESFFESKEYRAVFMHVQDMYQYSFKDSFSYDLAQCDRLFAEGKAAMNCTGTWSLPNIDLFQPDFEYGIFPLPGSEGDADLIFEPYHTFSGSAKTDKVDEILHVLDFVATDTELATYEAELSYTTSLVKDAQQRETPLSSDILFYCEKGNIIDASIGNVPISWEYQDAYSKYIVEWLFNEKNLDEALLATDAYKDRLK